MSEALIQALQNEALYDHPVDRFEVVETHISWVILTGPYAYKIKKPNDFGFLDFSTLEKRQHFCAEELRLNQRLAPNLYLELVSITGDESSPVLNGAGTAIEYAVKMRQFDQQYLLDRILERGDLTLDHINAIAETVAAFHRLAPVAESTARFGTATEVLNPVCQNFEQIRPFLQEQEDLALLDQLQGWAIDSHKILCDEFAQRKQQGFVRECHGDLHLGNITLIDDQITLFDCIEFNQEFRIIDVISEIAFFAMDLESRNLQGFANVFVNRYLELTGDYQGLKLLNFYKSYRAMVRAKVAMFRLHGASEAEAEDILKDYRRYAELARGYMNVPGHFVIMMHGFSGSGKSTVSNLLIEKLGAIRLRSDILRKQLFATESGSPATTMDMYSSEASDATFALLASNAANVLRAGYPLIADATFLKRGYRNLITAVAEERGVPCHILDCVLDDAQIRARLEQRSQIGADPSDADVSVYELQLASAEPLGDEELAYTLRINTAERSEIAECVNQLAKLWV